MLCLKHPVAVCSWSLPPGSAEELSATIKSLGLAHVHLGLPHLATLPAGDRQRYFAILANEGITVTAGMIGFPGEDYSTLSRIRLTGGLVPDADWPSRRELAVRCFETAAAAGIASVTGHAGFIPDRGTPAYAALVTRVADLGSAALALRVNLLLETGQETAAALHAFLHDVATPSVGVNFDPANMILYGRGDPIEAVRTLGLHIGHVHIKDARASDKPGETWGTEVPFGTGDVSPGRFLAALELASYSGALAIECEAGPQLENIRAAITVLAGIGA